MAYASTLADFALPRRSSSLATLALIVGGSVVTAVASQVSVPLPFTPVPVNGLTFAVLLCGVTLGWHRGAAAILCFLAEGAMGIPVFAQLKFGPSVLVQPTGGYLLAAPLAAALVGLLAQRRWDRSVFWLLPALLLGDALIFAGGLAWLSRFPLPISVWQAGLIRHLPGEAVKIALVMLMLPAAWKLVDRRAAARSINDPRD